MKQGKEGFEYADVVAELHELELSMLPSREELQESCVLSEGFYQRMERLVDRMRRKSRRRERLRYAVAGLTLAVSLGFLFHMQDKIEACRNVMNFYPGHLDFKFEEQLYDMGAVSEYKLGYVPGGYVMTERNRDWSGGYDIYRNNDRQRLVFSYDRSDAAISVDSEDKEYRLLTLEDGTEVHYLKAADGETSSVTWLSADGLMVFGIHGECSEEEFLRMTRSVTQVSESGPGDGNMEEEKNFLKNWKIL